MKDTVEDRAVELGEYIVQNQTTVRAAAQVFGISKSTVHMDVAKRLERINPSLYQSVREVLDVNKVQKMPKILFDRLKMRSHQIAYFFCWQYAFFMVQ